MNRSRRVWVSAAWATTRPSFARAVGVKPKADTVWSSAFSESCTARRYFRRSSGRFSCAADLRRLTSSSTSHTVCLAVPPCATPVAAGMAAEDAEAAAEVLA